MPATGRSIEAIESEAERLILQAKRMRIKLDDLKRILDCQWKKLTSE